MDNVFKLLIFNVGWRRDNLDWKLHHLRSDCFYGCINDHVHFKDINSYTVSGKAKWFSSDYYVRVSAEYGWTEKGRAHEDFHLHSPYLYDSAYIFTSDPVKRRSEVYDFDGAVGYPFQLCCSRLWIAPLIGFSFHRQHILVKEKRKCCCCSNCSDYCSCCCSSDYSYYSYDDFSFSNWDDSYSDPFCSFLDCHSSSFFVSSSNPFRGSPSSNPFSCSSDPTIASELGLKTLHRTNNYRFTWYGFYLGTDLAYALDACWILSSELEFHFLNSCHRKRKTWTGVEFLDHYHYDANAYGFNGNVAANYYTLDGWYVNFVVDFKWWKAHNHCDQLRWNMVGTKIGVGCSF